MSKKLLSPVDLLLAPELSEKEIKEIYKRYGFEDAGKADKNLQAIVKEPYVRKLLSEVIEPLFNQIKDSPDPDMVLNNLERFCSAVFDIRIFISQLKANPKVPFLLINLFSTSQFLSDIIIRNPEYLWWLIEERAVDTSKSRDDLIRELRTTVSSLTSFEKRLNAMRRFRRREILRIGLKDILGYEDVVNVTEELSYLADSLLQIAYEICLEELTKKFGRPMFKDSDDNLKEAGYAIIGMGKLGGEELNFSSDIDLIFVYDEDGETEGALKYDEKINIIANNVFFIKLSESIISAITEITDEGYCYRVDMRLRPDGKVGALARSLKNTEIYYESWGETWERQALIKARFCAGRDDVGRRFEEMIDPFVYRKYLDYAAISEIKHTKERIDEKIGARGERFQQVKLGHGGIREIEFIVQALQLIYAGKNRDLRGKNTLKTLHKLSSYNYLKSKDIICLISAYKFLRMVEHRLQMLYEFQTHTLPKDKPEILKLAGRLGYKGNKVDLFERHYKKITKDVRKIFEAFFYEKKKTKGHKIPVEANLILLLDIPIDDVSSLLIKYGFSDVERAYKNIIRLKGSEEAPLTIKTKNLLSNLMPQLLSFISKSPDPDAALNNLERFLSKTNMKEAYFKVFASHPYILELLSMLFGSSQFLSNILIKSPELLDGLVATDILNVKKTKSQMSDEFRNLPLTLTLSPEGRGNKMIPSPQRGEGQGEGVNVEFLNRLRRYKNGELIRIGIRDILNFADIETTFEELTDLADAVIQVLLRYLYKSSRGEVTSPLHGGVRLAVIGLGKFGGREIGYGSDLDIIFVYSAPASVCHSCVSLAGIQSSPSDMNIQEEAGFPLKNVAGMTESENLHSIFKLCEMIINIASEMTEEGILYKIDPRLRPLGKDGPLAMDIDAYKRYFKEWAQLWERQAYIKARYIAGDAELADDFIKLTHGFVYSSPITDDDVAEIHRIRNRMIDELIEPLNKDRHIKLSPGGIVDIEFITQILQLKYGYADKDIRDANTSNALKTLKEKGCLSGIDYSKLIDAYYFLRALESRIRIVEDTSLDILPADDASLEGLARRMGYRGKAIGNRLIKDFRLKIKTVKEIYGKIIRKLGEKCP
ncbi:MAG: bifunctional [glutamate--ammonia ligase]-adenylyl-L-tyrosine phosphorylase/[glutamate--ammonia-ligase] adenylyltransferase [Nitrospirota bacterium]